MIRNTLSLAVVAAMLTACGAGNSSNDPEPPPPPVNQSPSVSAVGDQSVSEGNTDVVTVSATDPDGDALTFSLSGDDAAAFSISSEGAVTFNEAPDFDEPTDQDEDNVYALTVSASDGELSDSDSFTVTVTNVVEGRTVDGPVSGATISLQKRAAGTEDEFVEDATTTSDEEGRFDFADYVFDYDTFDYKTISTGGVDIATGVDLGDLTLISNVGKSGGNVNVNAITTLLSVVDTEEEQQELIDKLGLEGTPEELIQTDIWEGSEEGDAASQEAQRVNSQLVTIIKTVATIVENASDEEVDPTELVEAVAEEVVEAAEQTSTELELSDPEVVSDVVTGGIEEAAPDAEVDPEVVDAASDAVAEVNSVLGDEEVDPTSDTATGVAGAAQEDLQESVEDVVTGETDLETFEEETDAENLLEDVPTDPDDPDADGDGLADTVDPDDDNDGVNDGADAFPFDSTESVDTDGDGVGNNADTDDDGDGVADGSDAYPLDAGISTPALEINIGSGFVVTDYDPATQSESTFDGEFDLVDGAVDVDISGNPLNQTNMANALSGGDFRAPTISIPVEAVPVGSAEASTVVQLVDGADATQDAGERIISFDLAMDWEGDGDTLTVELPPQTAAGFYETTDGLRVNVTVENLDSDFMSVTEGTIDYPATLDFKIAALIAKVDDFLPSSFLDTGVYTMTVDTTGVPMYVSRNDGTGTSVTSLEVTFSIGD
jgi:hypothetical protein